MTTDIQPRIETPHNPSEEFHQWVFLNGFRGRDVVVKRDAIGRPNPRAWREWIVLHCNNVDCPGTGIVPIGMLHALMESAAPVPTAAEFRANEGEKQ